LKDRKPRYIESLLKHAEIRNREKERRLERQVQKEREAEGDEFADKESFVTSAYRKKMEEMQKLEEEERKQDMVRNFFTLIILSCNDSLQYLLSSGWKF